MVTFEDIHRKKGEFRRVPTGRHSGSSSKRVWGDLTKRKRNSISDMAGNSRVYSITMTSTPPKSTTTTTTTTIEPPTNEPFMTKISRFSKA